MVDPKSVVEVRQDFDNYLVLIKVEPGEPFVYYMGAAWDRGLDFHTAAEWDSYVAEQKPDFDPSHRSSFTVGLAIGAISGLTSTDCRVVIASKKWEVSMNRSGGAVLALALMATAANLAVARAQPPAAERVSSPLATARRVADWQLAHMDRFDYVSTFRRDTEAPRDWVQATFYIGLTDFADATKDPDYAAALQAHGAREEWGFDARPRHADADATGQVWLWTAARSGDRKQLAPIIARFDAVLAAPSTVSLDFGPKPPEGGDPYCQARWCWSDALFMAPAAWVGLSKATGDGRYLAHADAEFWATTQVLYDPAEHLYFRDSRFIARRDPAGRKIFWGRGNGWVFGGLVRILSALPADHPSRPRYEALFRDMAARLVSLQGAQGYWPVSLLEPQETPETSGTGFFVYGLAWGINNGLLPAKTYRPAVDRGWAALERAVGQDGRLGWVQQIGVAPDKVVATDTQLYGAGAFLMAAAQVAKLK